MTGPDLVIRSGIDTPINKLLRLFTNYILTNKLKCGEKSGLHILREAFTDEKEFNPCK